MWRSGLPAGAKIVVNPEVGRLGIVAEAAYDAGPLDARMMLWRAEEAQEALCDGKPGSGMICWT